MWYDSKIRLEEFVREDGSCPYKQWFRSLEPQVSAKVAKAEIRMAVGNVGSIKWIGKIAEYRIHCGPGYRIYLTMEQKNLIVLLYGGTKRRQQEDVAFAKQLYREYKLKKGIQV